MIARCARKKQLGLQTVFFYLKLTASLHKSNRKNDKSKQSKGVQRSYLEYYKVDESLRELPEINTLPAIPNPCYK